jgi:hypothetical protein
MGRPVSGRNAAINRKLARESSLRAKAKSLGIGIAGKPTPQPRVAIPRCRCGCGKRAYWSENGPPMFYTRLCGYKLACKILAEMDAKAQ